MEMSCRDTVHRLLDYAEGRLPAERRAALERHLARCPRCVEFLASYRATPGVFRRATESEPPPGLERSLRERLGAALGWPDVP